MAWRIERNEMLQWAFERKVEFPCGCPAEPDAPLIIEAPIEHLLVPECQSYSDNLAVAIEVWKELAKNGVSGDKTFKSEAENIIRKKRPQWSVTRVIRVARIINCNPGTTEVKKAIMKLEQV